MQVKIQSHTYLQSYYFINSLPVNSIQPQNLSYIIHCKMGSSALMCCGSAKLISSSLENIKVSSQKIEQFLMACPEIGRYCQNPGRKYAIDMTTLMIQGGYVYIGMLDGDIKEGDGIMLYKQEAIYYEGGWRKDQRNGHGLMIFSNGDQYEGEWNEGLPHGNGKYVNRQPGWEYDGNWQNGMQHGFGVQRFNDNSIYEGLFSRGVRSGNGKFKNADQSYYKGKFKNNVLEGSGEMVTGPYAYEGEWKQGHRSGAGHSIWYDDLNQAEHQYIGEYKNNVKDGFGEYQIIDQITYKGKWQGGRKVGGIIISRQK